MPSETARASNSRRTNWPCLPPPGRRGSRQGRRRKDPLIPMTMTTMMPLLALADRRPRNGGAAGSLCRGISSASASSTIWRSRKSTAPPASRICGPSREESSERYEYIPAQLTVIEDVCKKYACACTVKTATKPPQPIEKSTAGASLLAQVIVAKCVDHLPLHRQEKIFERHGVEISRKTMGGWVAQCADLLQPLYRSSKE